MGKLGKTLKRAAKSITPSFLGGNAPSIAGHRMWADVKRTGRALDDTGIPAAAAGYVLGGPAGAVAAYGVKKQRDAMGALMEGDETVAPETTVMPEADSEEISRSKKRRMAAQLKRSGRASTILTDSSSSDQL